MVMHLMVVVSPSVFQPTAQAVSANGLTASARAGDVDEQAASRTIS